MPDVEEDLSLARKAALEAGRIALKFFRHDPRWENKPDHTPVSEADMAVDEALKEMLLAARPGYGWLSEETADDLSRLGKRRVWVLDPLDGTRGFLAGDPNWCVSLALVEDGAAKLGVIHAPALGKTWAARAGGGAFLDGRPITTSRREKLEGAHVIGPRSIHDPRHWDKPWPRVEVSKLPSLALRLAQVACAAADAMVAPGFKSDWDLAAGDVIIREAGGVITDGRGRPLAYNRRDIRPWGVVAAPPALHGQVMEHMKGYRCRGKGKGAPK